MSAKVILICGKVASGKTTYARLLANQNKSTILLSTDELMLPLFGQNPGANHHALLAKVENYLLGKSLELISVDINVILDWGFWTKERREQISDFFAKRGICYEWHYMDTCDKTLYSNLEKRNSDIENGCVTAYHFDNELAAKFWDMFDVPSKDEIDVWVGRDYRS